VIEFIKLQDGDYIRWFWDAVYDVKYYVTYKHISCYTMLRDNWYMETPTISFIK